MKKKLVVTGAVISLLATTLQIHAETPTSLHTNLESNQMISNANEKRGNHSKIFKVTGRRLAFRRR